MSFDIYLNRIFPILGFVYLICAGYMIYRYTARQRTWKIYTIIYLSSYSIVLFVCSYYFSKPDSDLRVLLFCMPFLFTLTAAAFLATRVVVFPEYPYSLKNMVHFIPVILAVIFLFILWSRKEPSAEITNLLFSEKFMHGYALICLLNILVYLGYQIIEISLKLKNNKEVLKSKIYKNTLIQLLVIRGLNLGLPLMIYIEIVFGFSIQIIKLTGIFLAMNSLLLTFFMAIYSLVFRIPRFYPGKNQFPDDEETTEIQWREKIVSLMEKEKPFLDENFKLEKLSMLLGIKRNAASAIINRCFGCTFLDLLHEYRITEVKKILESKQDIKPSLTGFEVGYKSISVYYSAFRKKTGMSPQEYRDQIKENNR